MTGRYVTVRIETVTRLNNSVNGNPRFRIGYSQDGEMGTYGSANTASDHSFNYEIGNPGFRVGDTVELSFSKSGTITGIKAVS